MNFKIMKAELLETIDETIISVCDYIKQCTSCEWLNENHLYPNGTIKTLAELIIARALINNINALPYSSSENLSKE